MGLDNEYLSTDLQRARTVQNWTDTIWGHGMLPKLLHGHTFPLIVREVRGQLRDSLNQALL